MQLTKRGYPILRDDVAYLCRCVRAIGLIAGVRYWWWGRKPFSYAAAEEDDERTEDAY